MKRWLALFPVVFVATLSYVAATGQGNTPSKAQPAPSKSAAKAAPAPANDDCLACHGDPDAKSDSGRRVAVDAAKFTDSVHGALDLQCVDCHVDLKTFNDFPHESKLAKAQCTDCHKDQVVAYERSIHAAARRQSAGSVAATCVDCHSVHEMRSKTDPKSMTYPLNLPTTCSRCHADAKVIAEGHIAIGNVADLYKDSIHGKAVSNSGLMVAANCTSCHGSHDIRKKSDPDSRVFRRNIPNVCGSCHEGIKQQYDKGVHGMAIAKGNDKAPVCADCHTAHQIQRADVVSWKLDTIRECGTCHADKITTYRDTFHGQVTSLGFVRVAACSDCHGAHEIHGKANPASMVSPERVLETCRKCHTTAGPNFAKYDPHADKHDAKRNPLLFYAAGFMKYLLFGVFGIFGLHAVLWFPRGFKVRRGKANHK
ncbi:MAG: cytochrome c3 family protein [Acidobacteria bacterium]|nr:cytochrome c3 family protein [Acidobacteriota bacterium]